MAAIRAVLLDWRGTPSRLGEHVGQLSFDELRQVDAALRLVVKL